MQKVNIRFEPTTLKKASVTQSILGFCPRCRRQHLNSTAITYANIRCDDCGYSEARAGLASRGNNPSGNILESLIALGILALGAYALASILDSVNE